MVRHDFPTPPPPTTTSLYSRRNCASQYIGRCSADEQQHAPLMPLCVMQRLLSAAIAMQAAGSELVRDSRDNGRREGDKLLLLVGAAIKGGDGFRDNGARRTVGAIGVGVKEDAGVQVPM